MRLTPFEIYEAEMQAYRDALMAYESADQQLKDFGFLKKPEPPQMPQGNAPVFNRNSGNGRINYPAKYGRRIIRR